MTKNCDYPELTKDHNTSRKRDILLTERGIALSECTERMRLLRK